MTAPFLTRLEQAAPESVAVIQGELARAVAEVERTRFSDVRVRRSLLGPPFTRRFGYAVRTQESGSSQKDYYRVSRGTASAASRLYWLAPVF